MEATTWPGKAKQKPENWDKWSEEAKAAFSNLWERAGEELREDYLEDIEERKGNQKDMDSYFIFLNDHKKTFVDEDEMEIGGMGCPLMLTLVLIMPAIILGAILL